MEQPGREGRRLKQGVVVSNKMQKTCVVEVNRKFRHPMYEKIVERSKKYYAHTEEKLSIGDVVEIMETRPLSKMKCWRIVQVIEKAKEPVEVLD